MFYQIFQRHWLIGPVVLTVVGSAVEAAAYPADISIFDEQPIGRHQPKLEPLSIFKDEADNQRSTAVGAGLADRVSEKQKTIRKNPPFLGKLGAMQREFNSAIAPLPYMKDAAKLQMKSFPVACSSLVLGAVPPCPSLQAQLPNPIIPRPPELPTPAPPPPEPAPLSPQTPAPPTPTELPKVPGTITVQRFEFVGEHKAFTTKQLAKVTAPFTGKPITFAGLLQAETAVTKLYTDAGYVNSGAAILANQTLTPEAAVVKIQIIEGGVEKIVVTGTKRLNNSYVRSRLERAARRPLNQNRLLEALQLLQLDPLIQNLSAQLSAGSRPELSVLEVKVTEANSFSTDLFTDNSRVPSVGTFRRGVRLSEGNLGGIGDRLTASYANTDGSNSLDLSYTVPINARNGTITLDGGITSTKSVEPPFDRVDITGNSSYYELSFRQPVIQTPTQEFALGITASRQESSTKIFGVEFPLSPGSDDRGRTRISALRLTQEFTRRNPRQVFALRSQFSLGIGAFDATVNKTPPDSRFFSWRGQAQYVRLLAPETLLVLRSEAQLSTRALVPLEQFSIGGPRSVRGYRQDQLLTDNGFFASAEVQLPIFRSTKLPGVLQIVPFADFGIGSNSSGIAGPNPNILGSVGLGLQWQMGNRLNARLDYGIPLNDINSRKRTLQEQGLYFSVNYSLF